MKKLIDKFEPQDVILWSVLIACITALALGKDGVIKDIMLIVIGVYGGKKGAEKQQGNTIN